VQGGVVTPIQGPGSDQVKYAPSLCHPCNSTGTQPYDLAYERFIACVLAHEDEVLRRRLIDFQEIYGASFELDQRNLFKYFVKSLGCRLVDAGEPVPHDLVELLPKDSFQTRLKVTFSVNEDVLALLQHGGPNWPGKGNLTAWQRTDAPDEIDGLNWSEYVNWLTIGYWYDRPILGPMGAAWIANAQYVYLGSFAPLSPEQRSQIPAKSAAWRASRDAKNGS
jgi:hypothetical protein